MKVTVKSTATLSPIAMRNVANTGSTCDGWHRRQDGLLHTPGNLKVTSVGGFETNLVYGVRDVAKCGFFGNRAIAFVADHKKIHICVCRYLTASTKRSVRLFQAQ